MRCDLHCPPKAAAGAGTVLAVAVAVRVAWPVLVVAAQVVVAVVVVAVVAVAARVTVGVCRWLVRWAALRREYPAAGVVNMRAVAAPRLQLEKGRQVVQGEVIARERVSR